jgi:hypothetical protein
MRAREFLRPTGFFPYLISYWLPAVGNPEKGVASLLRGEYSVQGYFCAFISIVWGVGGFFNLSGLTDEGRKSFHSLLLPGLTNPLLLAYLGLLHRHKTTRTCRILAVLILICMASSSVFFFLVPMIPLIGLYLWVAGIMMKIWPDLMWATREIGTRLARSST